MMIKKPKKIRDTDDLKNVNEQSQAMANANASFEKQNMNDSPSSPPNRSSQRLAYVARQRYGTPVPFLRPFRPRL